MTSLKNAICTVCGIIGSLICELFGGWSMAMTTLLIFMAIDYLTGILLALVWNRSPKSDSGGLDSRAGFKGLVRKGVILLVVLVAHRLDLLLEVDYIMNAVVIAFCTNELISLIENVGIMGVPIPKPITRVIEILKEKDDSEYKG